MPEATAPEDRLADRFAFDNSYARLPERFFARLAPAGATAPRLIRLNHPLAAELGVSAGWLESPEGVAVLAGDRVPEGAEPLAMAYAGHQFGNWVPRLGDGRALLLGEVIDRSGRRRDVQLKGSGRTPFSRMGDGRAPLGPVLREYVVSEAMAALGVPTTRSLAAVATGEAVARERVLPGAVLTRVASSHIRVGTFQYFYARRDEEALKGLLDHVVARHYPDIEPTALALLEAVMTRQADLIARWMGVGFVHGVMNTDNVTVSGETIDYGPCAFLDAYRPETVFSAIDAGGRYAFANQPLVAHWNLAQLAQALLPLVSGEPDAAVAVAQDAVDRFPDLYRAAWLRVMRAKLGLAEAREGDAALAEDLLARMAAEGADFTLAFRRLADLVPGGEGAGAGTGPRDLFADGSVFDDWAARWRARQAEERAEPSARRASMRAVNPLFVARNHRVEAALDAAEEGDLDPLDTLLSVLARPFDDQPGREAYAAPPRMGEAVVRTFCGT